MTDKPSVPRTFFRDVTAQFERAASQCEVSEYYYRIAEFTVKLRFAGTALLPVILPALSHLRVPPPAVTARPDLTVSLWDADSTGANLPPRPWSENDHLSRGDIQGFSDPVIRTAYTLGPNTLSMLDTESNRAVFCSTSAAHIPTDYRGSPLLVILSWWTSGLGLQYVHAGAVGRADGGVLVVGKGGSGKSTSALSCLGSELQYAADDYCLLDTRKDAPIVRSIYNSAKLEANHLQRFPQLAPLVSNPQDLDHAKAVIYLQEHRPEDILPAFPVKALLIPRVTGKVDTHLSPATQGEALRALAPSTLFQLSGSDAGNFGFMARFVRSVPNFFLNAGTDLPQIPRVIGQLLNSD